MNIVTYTVKPRLPAVLKPLEEIARNLWLSWNYDAVQLFVRLDYDLWMETAQSPIKTLGKVKQSRLEELAKDSSYIAALQEVYDRFQKYKRRETWYKGSKKDVVVYFSMEYGMDVSLPIYSGGLGILSGDHMKTVSDLNLPLVGVGLLYRDGYFQQYLNADGFQQENYPQNDWYNMPVQRINTKNGDPVKISFDLAGRQACAQIWTVAVGRATLYLLDTNIDENPPDLRDITASLYGGNKETRIQQEILLAIGGIRALRAIGINPVVTHMNEGHAAFLSLERIRELMKDQGFTFNQAKEVVWQTNIFTTHTPVPAGNERFDIPLLEKYMKTWATLLGLSWKDFLGLGRVDVNNDAESFCMTVLALKLSAYANGVAALHGVVSREMWKDLWPGLPVKEVPVHHVTNGVHPLTWISSDMKQLLDRYFGPDFEEQPHKLTFWERIDRISDEELWRTHERRKERFVAFARDRLSTYQRRSNKTGRSHAADALSPDCLTLCFARRFATYKRGSLLLRDPERLLKLIRDPERPVQLVFAGKAHPHDIPGKEIIKSIVHFAEQHDVQNRIIFIENYDMTVAHYMTSGGDVWLNTPRRPMEASGTSGMKAAMNGVLNCSILDGWWDEAYNPNVGWAIGQGEMYADENLQDEVESKALYDILEHDIIPLYYQRDRVGLPRNWIAKMKTCMREIGQSMSSHRMLMDYSEKFYFPALKNYNHMVKNGYVEIKQLSSYFEKIGGSWNDLKIGAINSDAKPVMQRGEAINVHTYVELGGLKPDDVTVQLYYGSISNQTKMIEHAACAEMRAVKQEGSGYDFHVRVQSDETGLQGHTVRIIPKHKALVHPFRPGFVKWA